jgi:hypothetical protein
MGRQGRQRARANYDWPVVMRAYRQLWDSLAEARRQATMAAPVAPGQPPHPLGDDPFRVFAGYATRAIRPDTAVSADAQSSAGMAELCRSPMTEFGADWRTDRDAGDAILDEVRRRGAMTPAQIADLTGAPESRLQRTIGYLLKFGLLRIAGS